jgi:hypothetical protein
MILNSIYHTLKSLGIVWNLAVDLNNWVRKDRRAVEPG